MKFTNSVWIACIILVGLIHSCRKDPKIALVNVPVTIDNPASYTFQKTPGTYWVYDWYIIDSTGAETLMGLTDTVMITELSTINGQEYAHYEGSFFNFVVDQYQRDSSGYIISPSGGIYYSLLPTGTVLDAGNNGQFDYMVDISSNFSSKTVPYGTFNNTTAYQLHWFNPDGSPFNNCGDSEFVEYAHYDLEIGQVSAQTAYISEATNLCQYRERRLVELYQP